MSKTKRYGSESDIQKEIFDFLDKEIGARVWINTPAFIDGKSYTVQGIPDITGVLPGGRHIAVEVKKTKSGAVSSQQKNHLVVTRQLEGEAWVVYDENLVEFMQYIRFMYPRKPTHNKTTALLNSVGLSKAKSGDVPAHRMHAYLVDKG